MAGRLDGRSRSGLTVEEEKEHRAQVKANHNQSPSSSPPLLNTWVSQGGLADIIEHIEQYCD